MQQLTQSLKGKTQGGLCEFPSHKGHSSEKIEQGLSLGSSVPTFEEGPDNEKEYRKNAGSS